MANNTFPNDQGATAVAAPLALTGTTDSVELALRAKSGQSANIQEWKRADGYVGASVSNDSLTLNASTVNCQGRVTCSDVRSYANVVIYGPGSLVLPTAANNSAGSGTLSGGTVTIANSSVTANSMVFFQATGGAAGTLQLGTITAGTGFVVTGSGSNTTFNYLIINSF